MQFNEKQEEKGAVNIDGMTTKQRIGCEHELKQTQNDFAYTMFAAKRSRQRSIINFVRMTDYMLGSTLHSLLISSCESVMALLESKMCDYDMISVAEENRSRELERCLVVAAESDELAKQKAAVWASAYLFNMGSNVLRCFDPIHMVVCSIGNARIQGDHTTEAFSKP